MVSWQTSYPELESAINTKSGVMNIFSIVMLVIIGIGILNLLLMAVYERTREIGLLGALGMKPGQITVLFLLEGALMGLVGVAFGVVFGLLVNLLLGQVGMDYSKFTGLTSYTALISSKIYPSLGIEKLPQHVLTVIVITLLASYYPAREAAQHEPAQALHYV
jgi:ABC-type lipoprotein release transport system permease subunit